MRDIFLKYMTIGILIGVVVPAMVSAQSVNQDSTIPFRITYSSEFQDRPGSDDGTVVQQAVAAFSLDNSHGVVIAGQLTLPFDWSDLTADSLVQEIHVQWTDPWWFQGTLGKFRLGWNEGNILAALDSLESVPNPVDPTAVIDGVSGGQLTFAPDSPISGSVLVLPKNPASATSVASRVRFNQSGFDASLAASRTNSNGHERDHLDLWGHYDWNPITFYTGTQWGIQDENARALVGVSAQIPSLYEQAVTSIEYLYNGEGSSAGADVGSYSYHYVAWKIEHFGLFSWLSANASLLLGADTGFQMSQIGLEYIIDSTMSVTLDYTNFSTWNPSVSSELDSQSYRNSVKLAAVAAF